MADARANGRAARSLELGDVLAAAHAAARGKKRSPDVAAFLLDAEGACLRLLEQLQRDRWAARSTTSVLDPRTKPRLLSALPFVDRVVQHLLIDATLPALERSFAPQSYACRRGFGTHRCLEKAASWTRTRIWVLRIDIAKFFPSIDHTILRSLLAAKTTPCFWPMTEHILRAPVHVETTRFHFPGDDLFTPGERPHGLPIGNLSSQIWANLMLTPIDHLLASRLGIGSFVRYCDDILVFDDDPERLRAAWQTIRARCDSLRLRLHPRKCRLHRTTEPFSFLGFVLERRGHGVVVRLRRENVRGMRARMRTLRTLYAMGAVDPDEAAARVRAWLAHARHGHTRALCERVLAELTFTRSGDGS